MESGIEISGFGFSHVGRLLVLRTWGQNLHHHPHVHGVVTGGGLSRDVDGRVDAVPRWRSCRPGFFLPVRVLSRVFGGKFLAGLKQLAQKGLLHWPTALEHLADSAQLSRWLTPLYQQDWVVYAKAPFGGPEQVLKYLARYTHRVAISNSRLLSLENGKVAFRYKDYAQEQQSKVMALDAAEFLRRFLQHVLPKGFVKIRHYGLLANRTREANLHQARRLLLGAARTGPLALTCGSALPQKADPACPACGSLRRLCRPLPPTPPALRAADTS